MCRSPHKAHRARFNCVTSKQNAPAFFFGRNSPYPEYQNLVLPCGTCPECRLRQAHLWAVRCVHENSLHDYGSFVTLTYDAKHLPKDGSLDPFAIREFVNRLRIEMVRKPQLFDFKPVSETIPGVRYMGCGEYGSLRHRPHYHAVLFNCGFRDSVARSRTGSGNVDFDSETLSRLWGKGRVSVGTLTAQSAGYTARYSLKKLVGDAKDEYKKMGIIPEFIRASNRPGIGARWAELYFRDLFPHNYCVLDGGHFSAVPRYYRKLLSRIAPDLDLETWATSASRIDQLSARSADDIVRLAYQTDKKILRLVREYEELSA